MKRIVFFFLFSFVMLVSKGQEGLSSLSDDQVRKAAEALFEVGDRLNSDGDYIRFDSNILIRLQGPYSKEDSLIIAELSDSIATKVDKWLVSVIPNSIGNLQVSINVPSEGQLKNFIQQNANSYRIHTSSVYLSFPEGTDYITRKKLIYYYVLRSMVVFRQDKPDTLNIPGSVFTEADPQKVTFNPIDLRLIREVYSLSRALPSTKPSDSKNDVMTYVRNRNFSSFCNLLAIMISYTFLIVMSLKGAFKKHDYRFPDFMKQALLVVLAISFYFLVIVLNFTSNRDILLFGQFIVLGFFTRVLLFFLGLCVSGVLFSVVLYFIERAIWKRFKSFVAEILTPMVSIAFVVSVLMSVFYIVSPKSDRLIYIASLLSYFGSFMLLGFVRSVYVYTRLRAESLIREKDVELAKLGELHKQAELQSLRAKINPHFLYNALNSIASLTSTNAGKAEEMALALSDFFKYSINREQKQMNSLSEELNAIRIYLEIEKVRFGERLNFSIICPPELADVQVPQLLIQPLVENAVKHGLSQITENGQIKIEVLKENGLLKIRVADNGPAFPDDLLGGFGIRNTQERLSLCYGNQAFLRWVNTPEKLIELVIPA